jgi:hypothetical protein
MMKRTQNREIQYRHAGVEIQTARLQLHRLAGVDSFSRPVAEVNTRRVFNGRNAEFSV